MLATIATLAGYHQAEAGYIFPMNFSEWLKTPDLLAAWYRGYTAYHHTH